LKTLIPESRNSQQQQQQQQQQQTRAGRQASSHGSSKGSSQGEALQCQLAQGKTVRVSAAVLSVKSQDFVNL